MVRKKDEQVSESEVLPALPEPAAEPELVAYTKAQYLASNRFTLAQKDILVAVLADSETYTVDAAHRAIETYLKGSVK